MKNIKNIMRTPKEIEKLVSSTLESIEKLPQAQPKAFFYTRVKARLDQRFEGQAWQPQPDWLLWLLQKQQWIAIAVLIVIALNLGVLFSSTVASDGFQQTENIQAIIQGYDMDETNTYSYLE